MTEKFPGYGRKRPQLNIDINRLHLDPENPRLPKNEKDLSEENLLTILYKNFDLGELADSLATNGYFDEEPLVAIPKDLPKKFISKNYDTLISDNEFKSFIENPGTQFIVAEGNRRLAAIKILLSDEYKEKFKIREWPKLSEIIKKDLLKLPVIIYSNRKDVIPYLGVRHVTGIKKWEPYAKAVYLANMKSYGYSIDDLQMMIGDRSTSTKKIYICYKLVEYIEEESEGSGEKAKSLFSYLLLALGQAPIKEYIGIPRKWSEVDIDSPVSKENTENLKRLFSFLFGEGKEKPPVIQESRDITNKLTYVLKNKEATENLISTRDLDYAYDLSDGEELLVFKQIKLANRSLEKALGIIHRYKTDEVKIEIKKCQETLKRIQKVIEE